jgi:hypothetical protein
MNSSDTPESYEAFWAKKAKNMNTFSGLEAIIMNPKCPTTLYSYIYEKAIAILKDPLAFEEMMNSGMGIELLFEMRKYLASHPKCPEEILRGLSDHSQIEIRVLVASNPNTEPEVLTKLSKVRSVQIKRGLIANPGLPEDIKEKIKL